MSTRNREYNPMCEDGFDGKIPMHTDQAFQHGIQFKIKVQLNIKLNQKRIFSYVSSLLAHTKYRNQQVVVRLLLPCDVFV
jgi:hypothetical protein